MVRWLPLEANPDVMNAFIKGLGVPEKVALVDVLGTDSELLQLVPKPVLAVLLLFPTSEKYEDYCKQKEEEIKASGESTPENVYFIKQSIENACGTIALIHAVANNREKIELVKDSHLDKFFSDTKDKTPEERGVHLENNEEISAQHSEHALLGQTEAPNIDEKVNLHFVTLVNIDGELYELDGRKTFPIKYGTTSSDTFIEDAAKICQQYMERDPGELRFSLVALTVQ